MKIGPVTQGQLRRLSETWKQGEHVLISGSTGSGKTALARHVDQIRIDRGGFVAVFVAKLKPDQTILDDYKGWTRWDTWKRNPAPSENKILLWPNTDKAKTVRDKIALQREVFGYALDRLSDTGKWNIHIDEGLYFCSPQFLGFGDDIAMLHAMGRSSRWSVTTLMQRPAHVPLIVYSSAAHAFIGRVRELSDRKRLSELGGNTSARDLSARIDTQGRHDFLWIPIAPDWPPEKVNLKY